MKKIIQGLNLITVIASVFFAVTSCVDEKYDLTEIDTEAVILKDISMPVGNLKPILISEFLGSEENELFVLDEQGNLSFAYQGDEPIKASVEVPSFEISFEEVKSNDQKLSLKVPSMIAGMDASLIQQYFPEYYNGSISFEEITGSKAHIKKTVSIEEQNCYLPYQLDDIKEVELDTELTYEFVLAVKDTNGDHVDSYGGAMYIEKDFTIDLPDWFVVNKNDQMDSYSIVTEGDNKNIIRFVKDQKIPADKSIAFKLSVDKVLIPSEFLVGGVKDADGRDCKKLQIDVNDDKNAIVVDGDVYIRPSDFTKIPGEVEMNMNLSFSDLNIKSALIRLNVEQTIADQAYNLPDLPEIFDADGVVLDIYDPAFIFDVQNPTPFDLDIYAHLFAYKRGVQFADMYLGENGQNVPFTLPKSYNGAIGFSRRGEGDMIAVPGIAELFRTLPDKVEIRDIRVVAGDDYFTIVPGQTLECSVNYTFKAPLAFGPELSVKLEYEVNELKLDLEDVGMRSVKLTFDAVNTIPLSFDVQAFVIGADGQHANDVTIDVDGGIRAGSLTSPSTSSISITLNSDKQGFNLDGLKLILNATCPSEYQGVSVNKNQGLQICNLKIALPEGLIVDTEDLLAPFVPIG